MKRLKIIRIILITFCMLCVLPSFAKADIVPQYSFYNYNLLNNNTYSPFVQFNASAYSDIYRGFNSFNYPQLSAQTIYGPYTTPGVLGNISATPFIIPQAQFGNIFTNPNTPFPYKTSFTSPFATYSVYPGMSSLFSPPSPGPFTLPSFNSGSFSPLNTGLFSPLWGLTIGGYVSAGPFSPPPLTYSSPGLNSLLGGLTYESIGRSMQQASSGSLGTGSYGIGGGSYGIGGGSYGGGGGVYTSSYAGYGNVSTSMAFGLYGLSSPSYGFIGYSTGGAKDINNFRENIENDYLPTPTDITYEGLFYDYYFDTGQQKECQELFCPSYAMGVSLDPFNDEVEYYMSVGLNSGIKESDFQRKKLNLAIVLDISGSMGGTFSEYYYDRFGNRQTIEDTQEKNKQKIQVATESIVALLDHLRDDDRFGMVVFESDASVIFPLRLVGQTNMQEVKDDILEIFDRGGTNLSSGMQKGTQLFNEYLDIDPSIYENRIIFLTDAMPNIGDTSSSGLLGMTKDNAAKKIYSTFIGIGVDFNTELVEYITKIRGANYYSVHSSTQFRERMDDGFEYMVTPLVFNLRLQMASLGYEIEKVFGSPEANEATGELMKVNTLFPSHTEEGGTRGGVVLLKLKKLLDDGDIELSVSYEDREGNIQESMETVQFGDLEPEYFANTGIRKAVLLSRYVSLIKSWIIDERSSLANEEPVDASIDYDDGIIIPIVPFSLGEWERQSVDLQVSEPYNQLFSEFNIYFQSEMNAIGDDTLSQEVTILEKLSTY